MSNLKKLHIVIFAMLTLLVSPVLAQEASANIKFSLFNVEGFDLRTTITFDEEFAAENEGLQILAPFKIAIPQQENITPLYNVGNGSNDE